MFVRLKYDLNMQLTKAEQKVIDAEFVDVIDSEPLALPRPIEAPGVLEAIKSFFATRRAGVPMKFDTYFDTFTPIVTRPGHERVKHEQYFTGKRRERVTRLCACGCGETFTTTFPDKLYKDDRHRKRAWKRQK